MKVELKLFVLRYCKLNSTNLQTLCATFMYQSFARSFLYLHFKFALYWRKTVGAKAARRTLMKLNPGIKFKRCSETKQICFRSIKKQKKQDGTIPHEG
jgi:hypothetical protein